MMEEVYQKEVKKGLPIQQGLDFVKYIGYRELRLSGFVLKEVFDEIGEKDVQQLQCGKKPLIRMKLKGIWKKPFFYSWEEKAKRLYDAYWLGQHKSYKRKRGAGTFFDHYESYYLMLKKSIPHIIEKPPYFDYYWEWRECGYVVKSAFKFGALFRIYEPGTTPERFRHSSYLLRVLEKKRYKGLEFFSVLRIAESVKKRLLIPVKLPGKERTPHFALYKGSFLGYVVLLHEDASIYVPRLLEWVVFGLNRKTSLFIGVVDRDTSLTLFKVNVIRLERDYLLVERVKY